MRYTSDYLPEYAHRPGETVHPNKEGGHYFGKKEPEQKPLTQENYVIHHEYLYGIDLYNHGYFWESHVYWEAAWNGCGRKGKTADFLKALILLAAGRLKYEIGQNPPALGHYEKSKGLFESLECEEFAGMDIENLIREIASLVNGISEKNQQNAVQQHRLTLNVE